jgi:fatty-acyl-CoA synthase
MTFIAPDWIAHHAAAAPDRRAMTDAHSGRSFTYAEMNDRCARLAAYLRHAGVARGDRVAVLCHNSTDIFEIQFACCKLGAAFVPLNWRLASAEIAAIMQNAAPAVLIHGAEFLDIAQALRTDGLVNHIIATGDGLDSEYERAIRSSDPLDTPASLTHDDVLAIMYTSGTTGLPKGVLVTQRMAIFSAVNGMMKAGVADNSVGLTFLPLFHVGGLFLMANFIFHAGGHNVVMRSFDAAACLSALADKKLRVTHAFGVPTNFAMIAELPEFTACDLNHIQCLLVGGAPSPIGLLNAYAGKRIRLQQGWGMTETATIGTVLSADHAFDKIGSAGRAVMHAELAILDENHRFVPTGDVGQLAIRGPTVTPGYWRQPEATNAAFHDGWFLTGDAARVDQDGFYYIVDRWKDMYISGGENVYPAEIESVLSRLSGVVETAVIGVPDEKWGEVGCAFIVGQKGGGLTADDVMAHCAAHLARFKLPKRVIFVDEIPHTAAGKIAKPALRKSLGGL